MSSRDVRPTSAQSRTAWADMDNYGSSGAARPDNQFEFGPRDDPDLPHAMENDTYMNGDRRKNEVAVSDSKKSNSCVKKLCGCVRCKYCML